MAEPFTRMCAACRQHRPQRELVRLVKGPEGQLLVDTACRLPGRGLYLCRDAACVAKARKARFAERTLSAKAEDLFYESLTELVEAHG